jgi:hypothetical protein
MVGFIPLAIAKLREGNEEDEKEDKKETWEDYKEDWENINYTEYVRTRNTPALRNSMLELPVGILDNPTFKYADSSIDDTHLEEYGTYIQMTRKKYFSVQELKEMQPLYKYKPGVMEGSFINTSFVYTVNSDLKNLRPKIRMAQIEKIQASIDSAAFVIDETIKEIKSALQDYGAVKSKFGYKVMMNKTITNELGQQVDTSVPAYFWGKIEPILANATDEDIKDFLKKSEMVIADTIERFCNQGSSWIQADIVTFYLRFDKYTPIVGASHIPMPQWLSAKNCCVNIDNKDNRCFEYACTAAYGVPKVNRERVSNYKDKNLFNFTNMLFPVPVSSKSFEQFERNNSFCALNVFIMNVKAKRYIEKYYF